MLWVVAWEQSPCGSLPCDESLVAAKLEIDAALFAAHRHVIMRGWIKHNDMRLYHLVVTSQVLEMISIREANRGRQSKHRNVSRVTNTLVTAVEYSKDSKNKGLTPASRVTPVDNSGRWWKTMGSIIEMGQSVGIIAVPGESRDSLYKRVRETLKNAAK